MRSIRAIEESDVCILLIDATRGMEAQDLNIFHLIERNRKGVVIVVNKWDLVEKDGKTLIEYEKSLREKIAPFKDVDIIFASALTKQRLLKVLEAALQVYANRTQKIKTSELNRIMLEAIENYPPPSLKGKYVKIKYITQLPTHAPSFAFYCNLPQYVKRSLQAVSGKSNPGKLEIYRCPDSDFHAQEITKSCLPAAFIF